MKIIKVLGLISFLTISILAQEKSATISGRLTSYGDALQLTVVLQKDGSEVQRTQSDNNGYYKFENLSGGKYTVIVVNPPTLTGENSPQEVIIKDNKTATADFEFIRPITKPVSSQIKETVTISADTNQTIEQVSKTVNVIDGQEMRDRADFSLAETLRTIPGFRIQQLGGFGRTANVKTRGLRNQDTAVLIDGIRFRDASAITGDASPFLSDFTLTSVSKIEVLRGSGSSLYGTNAIGGTIDFQTPKPQEGWHGQLSGAFGNLGLGRFRGNISNGNDKFGFNIGVSRTVYTKGIDGDDDARNTNFQSRIEYNPFEKTNVSGRFFFSDAFVLLNSNPDTFGTLPANSAAIIDAKPNVNFVTDADDPDNRQKSKFFNGQIVVTQVLGENFVVQGFYSGLKTSRRNINGSSGGGFQPFGGDETYVFDGQIHTINAHLNWNARNNQLTAGYEYEFEKFGNEGVFVTATNNFSTVARQSSNTFFVQDLIGFFNGKLQFSGAFRAQWFSLRAPTFSSASFPNRFLNTETPPASYTGDGSVSYYFEKTGTKLRAHLGNGYRVPSLYERFGSYFFLNSFFGLGNPALKPEKSIAFDGAIEQSFLENRAKFTATYFYTKITDEVSYLPTDDFGAPAYYNADKHFSRGAEISANVKPTGSTDVFASYTFTNSDIRSFRRQTFMPPLTLVSKDVQSNGIPAHQFTFVVTQRIKRAWINVDFLGTSSYLAPIFSNTTFQTYTFRFKGNRRADLTGGYTFSFRKDALKLRVFATIENIFDYDYYENGFRTTGRAGRIGLSFGF